MSEENPFERYDPEILKIILNSNAFESEKLNIPKELVVDYVYSAFMNGYVEGYKDAMNRAKNIFIEKETFVPMVFEKVEILGEEYSCRLRKFLETSFKSD